MPSVRGGRDVTGFSFRNLAVDGGASSDFVSLAEGGVLNWKNSYSAVTSC